jgi:hypothetical protein
MLRSIVANAQRACSATLPSRKPRTCTVPVSVPVGIVTEIAFVPSVVPVGSHTVSRSHKMFVCKFTAGVPDGDPVYTAVPEMISSSVCVVAVR